MHLPNLWEVVIDGGNRRVSVERTSYRTDKALVDCHLDTRGLRDWDFGHSPVTKYR